MIPARTALRIGASFAVLTVGSLVMLLVAIPTLGLARRFYSDTLGRWIGWSVLRIAGIRYRTHGMPAHGGRQTVYVANHTSTLDGPILMALGLPRVRFFLSRSMRRIVPLAIIGTLVRMFWTVPQQYPEERRRIFERADRVLRRTGDSVYLSPEGKRMRNGEIGAFNKGAFHLATSLRAQIIPIYISIPRDIDPGMGYHARSGVADVYFLPPIDTSDWRLEDLDTNREAVRELFLRVHSGLERDGRLPADLTVAREQAVEVALS